MLARRLMHLGLFPVDILAVSCVRLEVTSRLPIGYSFYTLWSANMTCTIGRMSTTLQKKDINNPVHHGGTAAYLLVSGLRSSILHASPGTRDAPHPHGR